MDQGRFDEAEALVNRSLDGASGPQRDQLHAQKGCLYLEQGRLDEALALLEPLKGRVPRAEACLARSYSLSGRDERAVQVGGAIVLSGESDVDLAVAVVSSALRSRRYDEALALVSAALRTYPAEVRLLVLAADVALALGDLAGAEAFLERCLALAPDQPEVFLSHGRLMLTVEKYAAAAKSLEEALSLQPDYPEALRLYAVAQMQLGEFRKAATALEALRADVPGDVQVLNNLGVCLIQLKQLEEAHRVLAEAVATEPRSPALLGNLADVCVRLGNFDCAVDAVRRWKSMDEGCVNAQALEKDLVALDGLLRHICEGEKIAVRQVREEFGRRSWSHEQTVSSLERILEDPIFSDLVELRLSLCVTPPDR